MSENSVGKSRREIISQKVTKVVSSLYDILKSTIADVEKEREKIKRHVSASDNPPRRNMSCKKANLEKLTMSKVLLCLDKCSKRKHSNSSGFSVQTEKQNHSRLAHR